MKVIFLDFDGVINNIHHRGPKINKEFIEAIKKVIALTNAKVVITSSWKRNREKLEYGINALIEMGIEIYDCTPNIDCPKMEQREKEINLYLEHHQQIEQFVIIEDDFVMKRLYDHQVLIEHSDGFTANYIEPTVGILNGSLGFYPPEYNREETFKERAKRLFPSAFLEESTKNKQLQKYMESKESFYKGRKK